MMKLVCSLQLIPASCPDTCLAVVLENILVHCCYRQIVSHSPGEANVVITFVASALSGRKATYPEKQHRGTIFPSSSSAGSPAQLLGSASWDRHPWGTRRRQKGTVCSYLSWENSPCTKISVALKEFFRSLLILP